MRQIGFARVLTWQLWVTAVTTAGLTLSSKMSSTTFPEDSPRSVPLRVFSLVYRCFIMAWPLYRDSITPYCIISPGSESSKPSSDQCHRLYSGAVSKDSKLGLKQSILFRPIVSTCSFAPLSRSSHRSYFWFQYSFSSNFSQPTIPTYRVRAIIRSSLFLHLRYCSPPHAPCLHKQKDKKSLRQLQHMLLY